MPYVIFSLTEYNDRHTPMLPQHLQLSTQNEKMLLGLAEGFNRTPQEGMAMKGLIFFAVFILQNSVGGTAPKLSEELCLSGS